MTPTEQASRTIRHESEVVLDATIDLQETIASANLDKLDDDQLCLHLAFIAGLCLETIDLISDAGSFSDNKRAAAGSMVRSLIDQPLAASLVKAKAATRSHLLHTLASTLAPLSEFARLENADAGLGQATDELMRRLESMPASELYLADHWLYRVQNPGLGFGREGL